MPQQPLTITSETNPLLGNRDAPPYTLLNPEGTAPILLACDHASNAIPASLGNLGLVPALRENHIAYDIGSAAIGRILMERFDAPLLLANYSRLVIDLNRHTDDPTLIPEVSDGHLIHGNQDLSVSQHMRRVDEVFTPYHDTYHRLTRNLKSRFRRPLVFAVHSFTPVIQGVDRPWHFGVLWDRDQELAERLIRGFEQVSSTQSEPLLIGDNQPYHARAPLGYAMIKHTAELDVEMILIETRQDLVSEEKGQRWAADILYQVLAPLLDDTPACS